MEHAHGVLSSMSLATAWGPPCDTSLHHRVQIPSRHVRAVRWGELYTWLQYSLRLDRLRKTFHRVSWEESVKVIARDPHLLQHVFPNLQHLLKLPLNSDYAAIEIEAQCTWFPAQISAANSIHRRRKGAFSCSTLWLMSAQTAMPKFVHCEYKLQALTR